MQYFSFIMTFFKSFFYTLKMLYISDNPSVFLGEMFI